MQKQHRLLIRTDANIRIGTGHLMRCLALAQAWQDAGGVAAFLMSSCARVFEEWLQPEEMEVHCLSAQPGSVDDAKQTAALARQVGASWVVVDGYHFTPDYQKAIRKNGYRLLIIDDMVHLDHYHADILLNQNIHASSLIYSCDRDTVKLLGCEYVLLRREFLKYKDWKREIPEKAKKILVTMGGSDPDNVTLKVIRALNRLSDSDLEIKIIAGPVNTNTNSLEKELHLSPFTFHLLTSASNMPSIMAWADMAVSAGGSTCWELMFVGVPFLVIILSENQVGIANGLGEAGAAVNCGWHYALTEDGFVKIFVDLIKNRKRRMALSRDGRQMVDGFGSERVMKRMRSHLE